MPHPDSPVHVRLALHPVHRSAVTAAFTGAPPAEVREVLLSHGFRDTEPGVMVLARIDREEPHYTARAVGALARRGHRTTVDPALQEEIDTEWTWGGYPMPWLTRDEIREVGAAAQVIHDDIVSGRLTIRLHAHDGYTIVAVGTHEDGRHLHFHGEDHLRQITGVYDTETEAVADFHRLHTVAVRPGPAPATETERAAAEALTIPLSASTLPGATTTTETPAPTLAKVPGPGEHEALLTSFLDAQRDWERYRTWSDATTHAVHENLCLRVELDHEARDHTDIAWSVAAYDSPVGQRLWHATATVGTPIPIISTFLAGLASDNAWTDIPEPLTETSIAEAIRPLADAGWAHTVDGHRITVTAPGPNPAGVTVDPLARPGGWTLWSGPHPDRPDWTVSLSRHTPPALLQDLTHELAHGADLPAPQLRPHHPPVTAFPSALRPSGPSRGR
ncbi:DUF317 domain-containing protein [Streptomyces sp. NPDC006798]|uniref:DUF317 domain-containing protein n=1 Tax=Streptomyces sp. NPDC006798 TaxID=3155462 RepID=UPI0033FC5512